MLSDLRSHEHQIYSQGGEDGVLARILECIGTTNKTFVEFGAWDGEHVSNTANLRLHHGWSGLLMDGNPKRCNEHVKREFVTADNVNELLAKYEVPRDFDLLSIDIDGNEYWVWRALDQFRPRIVVMEYNVFFGIEVSKTIHYEPNHVWDETYYHGASLAALRKLGREKGYSLIYTDSYAPNAFFVLDSELDESMIDLPIEQVSSWNWVELQAEPPIGEGRSWFNV